MTIECFNFETAHHFGTAFSEQFRLRHRVFIERQNYQVPSWKGMEYDQFDTPATQYFVWRDEDGIARGAARLAPTSINYMIEELWPDKIVDGYELPHSDQVWEVTRFGVDNSVSPRLRMQIVKELICALLEFGILQGITQMIGLTAISVIRNIFTRNGWDSEMISQVWLEDGIPVQAGVLPVSIETLQQVRSKTKLGSVLRLAGDEQDDMLVAA